MSKKNHWAKEKSVEINDVERWRRTLFRERRRPINVRDPREITIRGYQWKSIPPLAVSATTTDHRRRWLRASDNNYAGNVARLVYTTSMGPRGRGKPETRVEIGKLRARASQRRRISKRFAVSTYIAQKKIYIYTYILLRAIQIIIFRMMSEIAHGKKIKIKI